MAEARDEVVNVGDQITTPPAVLPVKAEDQFRLINQRLDKLTSDVQKIADPPTFRVADFVNFAALVIGMIVAVIAAFGFSERMTDFRTHQADSERRIDTAVTSSEVRLGAKLDKLSDQFTSMDERTSRIEGAQGVKPQSTHEPVTSIPH